MPYTIEMLAEFLEWFQSEKEKSKTQIRDRLARITDSGHFGHVRDLGEGLFELKFNDGRRIYYTIIPIKRMLLILGGNKNGQNSDIAKARKRIPR